MVPFEEFKRHCGKLCRGILLVASTVFVAGCSTTTSLESRFQSHIAYLASDELEGRGIGSGGIDLAADYIARHFRDAGLEPASEDGTYFQTFPMTLRKSLTDEGRLAFDGDSTEYRQGRDFIPLSYSSDAAFQGEVVFCGYGIVEPEKQHDDFIHLDLLGKVALILFGEPPTWADANGYPTRHAMPRNKIYNARDRGATGVLLVNAAPQDQETDRLTEFDDHSAEEFGIPSFHVSRALAETQLRRAGLDTLDDLQRRVDSGSRASAVVRGVAVSGKAVFQRKVAPVRNVLGVLPGRGALADEVIVIGAHYDHLGIQKPFQRRFREGKLVREIIAPQIHNGADDNASGVSGLIEIARMFARERDSDSRRGILFIAFTAEESGLHGSKRYIEQPAIPLDKTAAMLNMDMIGRMPEDADRVQVFGVDCGREFGDIVESAAKSNGLTVARGVDEGGRSDHAPFVRKNIPSMHFFSGHHSDYHQPGDDAEKINARGGAKITRLVHQVAGELARRRDRVAFVEPRATKQDPSGPTPTFRVVMGIAPNYADDGQPGMGVDGVTAQGPADLAGMKSGDRIIRINHKPIANIYDYMASTRNNKAGDVVEVVVLRDGKEVPLQVTLSGAR